MAWIRGLVPAMDWAPWLCWVAKNIRLSRELDCLNIMNFVVFNILNECMYESIHIVFNGLIMSR